MEINPEVYQVVEALKTKETQWVQPTFGEHIYIESAVHQGLKLSPGIIPWRWKDRDLPIAYLEASHSGAPQGTSGSIKNINNITIYQRPEEEYAVIINDSQETPCSAKGSGGHITVICYAEHPGKLVLKEYTWSGWKAWRDGKRVDLLGKQWLSVVAPAGKYTYTFRYHPWDVPLGMMLSGLGIALSLGIWFSPPLINKEDQEMEKKT